MIACQGAGITRPSSGKGVSVALTGRGVQGGGCAVSLVLCFRIQGFLEKGCQAPFESSSYLCLQPFGLKCHVFPSDAGRRGG